MVRRLSPFEGSRKGYSHDIPEKNYGRVSEYILCHLCAERSTWSVKLEGFSEDDETENLSFREFIGSLMWLAIFTRTSTQGNLLEEPLLKNLHVGDAGDLLGLVQGHRQHPKPVFSGWELSFACAFLGNVYFTTPGLQGGKLLETECLALVRFGRQNVEDLTKNRRRVCLGVPLTLPKRQIEELLPDGTRDVYAPILSSGLLHFLNKGRQRSS